MIQTVTKEVEVPQVVFEEEVVQVPIQKQARCLSWFRNDTKLTTMIAQLKFLVGAATLFRCTSQWCRRSRRLSRFLRSSTRTRWFRYPSRRRPGFLAGLRPSPVESKLMA